MSAVMDNWLRDAVLGAPDELIQRQAHLFATFYLALIAGGVPAPHAVLMTQAYIQANVAGSWRRTAEPANEEANG